MGSKKKRKKQPKYCTVDELVDRIDEPNGGACRRILQDCRALFQMARGSRSNHQAWLGGYIDHVTEVMNLAVVLYRQLNHLRPLPFSLSDALLVLFLHDFEKPWKYELDSVGGVRCRPDLDTKIKQQDFRRGKFIEYGITLTPALENGLEYVEGELHDYRGDGRMMGELAAFAHLCDVWSARGWHGFPLFKGDPWHGADRRRKK